MIDTKTLLTPEQVSCNINTHIKDLKEMKLNSLTHKLAELSRELATLDQDSDEYYELEAEIALLEDEIDAEANAHTKYDFQ